jgi:hypothetical protein
MAGRAPTYPEVVNDFRTFVQALDRVVIAIDEIDRIGAGEQARRFLSELKAIFDIPGCYYLVSVSTEAQHDFELSGMGLRSVFDSSDPRCSGRAQAQGGHNTERSRAGARQRRTPPRVRDDL